MVNQYKTEQWSQFREEIFEMDGYACVRCGRARPEVVLQVHHKKYVTGRAVWDYPSSQCETICKGCHAAEHGKIMPQSGWDFVSQGDLGDLIGKCERCGTVIRHTFFVDHPNWYPMVVGTVCCDDLTGTQTASKIRKFQERKKRFLSSSRWIQEEGYITITQKGLRIRIGAVVGGYRLEIHGKMGKEIYDTEEDAKMKVFEFIDSGQANEFFAL